MFRAVVSTKYQVVIPKGVRQEIGLKTGHVVEVIRWVSGDAVCLISERALRRSDAHNCPVRGLQDH
jgi:AbrB family looped-hinge helix DNA binding protein